MKDANQYSFEAEIYKTGINFCVDVPNYITSKLLAIKGYIKVKGTINGFQFKKSLVPVKNGLFRLFINIPTLKGGQTKVGETANFVIEQDFDTTEREYPVPDLLKQLLDQNNLTADFDNLSKARRKDILKYLSNVKTKETLQKNIQKLIEQLELKLKNVRLP
jgi:hypothetical protein